MNFKQILISGFLLWLFSVVGTTLVAITQQQTIERIAANEKKVLLKNLYALIPASKLNNDIAQDSLVVDANPLLGTQDQSLVYRARMDDEPVAAVFNTIAPDGYSGAIHLLVGVYANGKLAGVRVVKHNETPGLGDGIEIRKSDWILAFDDQSLENPLPELWKVKRDGGVYDQMTGATITPRAIVKAVKNTLVYFTQNHETLFL
ncbi:MAG: electron transport complex subunit RsxG [Gammaproteobacteria bacterium]|nr:electron transport complex subunit RsxG [Gammaproteobacteria bacterium]